MYFVEEVECLEEDGSEMMTKRIESYREEPGMKLTGEDIQMVMDCDCCGPAVTEFAREDCEDCGDSWVREDYKICILGNDVVSPFPSLDSKDNGKR